MAEVNWYEQKVNLVINKAISQSLEAIAFRVEDHCKEYILEAPGASGEGLVDTGFMINSVYVVLPDKDSYGDTWPSGDYEDLQGEFVERNIAPKQPAIKNGAVVAVGAEYAIYQEMEYHFLFNAVQETATEIGALVKVF